jgi:hypothetical protein
VPYAKEENLAVEVGEECVSLSQRTRFTAAELQETARYIFGCGETLDTFRKVVMFSQQAGGSPVAVAILLNELAFENGRAT